MAPLYTVWQIDAWAEGERSWTWNDKFRLFEFRSHASDIKKAFLRRLRKHLKNMATSIPGMYGSLDLGRGWYRVDGQDYVLELVRRSDGCPVYACIREDPF